MSGSSCQTISKLLGCKNEETVQKPVVGQIPMEETYTEKFTVFRSKTRDMSGYDNWEFKEGTDPARVHDATLEFFESERSVNTDVKGAFYMFLVKKKETKVDMIAGHYELVDTDKVILTGYSYGSQNLHLFGLDFDKSGKGVMQLLKVAKVGKVKSRWFWDDVVSDADSVAKSVTKVVKHVEKEVKKTVDDIKKDLTDTWKSVVKSIIKPTLKEPSQVLTYCAGEGISLLANVATIAAALEAGSYTDINSSLSECLSDYVIQKNAELLTYKDSMDTLIDTIITYNDFEIEDIESIGTISTILSTASGVTGIVQDAKAD